MKFFKGKNISGKKLIGIVIAVLLIIAITTTVVLLRKRNKNSSDVEEIKTSKAYENVFTSSIDISGYLEAADLQNVQFRSTGAITGVFVKVGDIVKKGDLLATIDDTSPRYNLLRAEQELEKNRYTASAKELELLELNVQNAKNNMEYTRATAYFDGVVAEVNIAEGDYTEAAKTLNLMQIANLSYLKAEVEVDEIDVKNLKEGMQVQLNFDSLPGEPVTATIAYIPLLGTYNTSSGIGVKKVELRIYNPPENLYPGYSFSATIVTKSETKYLMVQSSAIKSRRGKSYITKQNEDGSTKEVEVTVRYLGEGLSQVLSGDIKNGDTYILNPQSLQNKNGGMMGGGPPMGGPGGPF